MNIGGDNALTRAWTHARSESVNLQKRPETQTVPKQTARANMQTDQTKGEIQNR